MGREDDLPPRVFLKAGSVASRDRIVIGASAGGVEVLIRLVGSLPADLPAALFVVLHTPANHTSRLPQILARHGKLPAAHARDGEAIAPGRIYVAPPDEHLLAQDGSVRLSHGPRENHTRPAIDVLFRSAANAYGERVVGVVLSGTLWDGTAGLIAIKRQGGVAIVQDPEEAGFAAMPRNAISGDHPDWVLPLADIATTLVRLAREPLAPAPGA